MSRDIDENITHIRRRIKTSEALGQLAEEACELAQAALKIQRLGTQNNKPAKTVAECYLDLYEEIADVILLLRVIGLADQKDFEPIMEQKSDRWVRRLDNGPV